MRILMILACGALAACTSSVTAPDDQVLMEVPPAGTASSAGGDNFTGTIEGALNEPARGTVVYGGGQVAGTPLDDDRLNLMEYTLERQRIDAAIAERELADARSQLVVVQPGALPNRVEGANIALFAQQTNNAVGQRIYQRSGMPGLGTACGRYGSPDQAQRAFLAAGGPQDDRLGLDGDGDGFACRWDPTPYRQLRL